MTNADPDEGEINVIDPEKISTAAIDDAVLDT